MDALLKKLNYKSGDKMVVLHAPAYFAEQLKVAGISAFEQEVRPEHKLAFVMAFVTTLQQIEEVMLQVGPRLEGDVIVWMCYPKGSSKKYACEFNRDTGWQILGTYRLEPVKQVAIDEDWSGLRFRKLEFIKKLTRKFGLLSDQQQTKTNG